MSRGRVVRTVGNLAFIPNLVACIQLVKWVNDARRAIVPTVPVAMQLLVAGAFGLSAGLYLGAVVLRRRAAAEGVDAFNAVVSHLLLVSLVPAFIAVGGAMIPYWLARDSSPPKPSQPPTSEASASPEPSPSTEPTTRTTPPASESAQASESPESEASLGLTAEEATGVVLTRGDVASYSSSPPDLSDEERKRGVLFGRDYSEADVVLAPERGVFCDIAESISIPGIESDTYSVYSIGIARSGALLGSAVTVFQSDATAEQFMSMARDAARECGARERQPVRLADESLSTVWSSGDTGEYARLLIRQANLVLQVGGWELGPQRDVTIDELGQVIHSKLQEVAG